ncbi:MAG: DUF4358 domain-containing protein [Firmicutes bacterium]|nr:DUF4358 domain-containing protein [Bacillota bacterium]
MKNIIFIEMIVCSAILLTGCVERREENVPYDDPAYLNEGNGEEDAVNTLQVGSKYKIAGPMDELKDAIIEILGDHYWPDTLLSAEELAERTGISENMYDDFLAEYQRAEAGIDMIILIKAKENEVETVEKYLNEYRDVLLNIYEQQSQNEAKVFASRIEVIDNYVCYIQLGADITSLVKEGKDAMVAYCQQENERALDILEKRILNT